jgi:fatty-acyl-CoA synthase
MPAYIATTFGELPSAAAARFGDREALIHNDERYTFKELEEGVARAARGLVNAGIEPGEHVSLWLLNCSEWMFASFALARIGAVHIPINTRLRTHDLHYILGQSDSTTLITHATAGGTDYLAMARELVALPATGELIEDPTFPRLKRVIIVDDDKHPGTHHWNSMCDETPSGSDAQVAARSMAVDPTGPVFIMYTSGTTGFPKGVVHNHCLIRNVQERGFRMAITTNDTILNFLPLFHAFGYSEGALMSLITGARQIITSQFDPDACLDIIERESVTVINGFEAHAKGLSEAQLARPRCLESLRTGIFAAGMLSATPVARLAAETLKPLKPISGFGMTEVWLGVSIGAIDEDITHRTETSGFPAPGYEVRILDAGTGQPCAPLQPGELEVAGDYLMMGYYNMPEETANAYTKDGWFKTGDMAHWCPDGYLRFLGRYKDMLKVGGENVDPMEVEGLLLGHPQVHQVAVVGLTNDRLGEVGVAFVQPTPDSELAAQTVIDYCLGKVASFKVPRHVVFVNEFPMTASGKIRKVELREKASQILSSDAGPSP